MQPVAENRFLKYSLALHIGVTLVFLIGFPAIFSRTEPQPLVLTVEILPIGDVTNVKPSDKPIQEKKTAKAPVNVKPIPKTMTEQPKEVDPEPKEDDVADPDKADKPIEKPVEKPKPAEKPKPKVDDFAALMSKLKQQTPAKETDAKSKDTESAEENKTKSDAPYDPTKPLSLSEQDAIRSQFVKCWRMPAGARDAGNLAVRVRVKLTSDGAVTEAKIAPEHMGRYRSDTFFRAAADSAVRAVYKCSPLQNLSPDKYSSWSQMELNFDPAELM